MRSFRRRLELGGGNTGGSEGQAFSFGREVKMGGTDQVCAAWTSVQFGLLLKRNEIFNETGHRSCFFYTITRLKTNRWKLRNNNCKLKISLASMKD